MAGNGRRCRSRRDYAADVAQAVRAGALSAQEPHEPPRQRAAHSFAQVPRGATEGGSRRPHSRMRVRSSMGAYRALVAKYAPDGFRESNPEPVLGQGGACEEAASPRAVTSKATLLPLRAERELDQGEEPYRSGSRPPDRGGLEVNAVSVTPPAKCLWMTPRWPRMRPGGTAARGVGPPERRFTSGLPKPITAPCGSLTHLDARSAPPPTYLGS